MRIEKDSMGEVSIPDDKLWGSQTQRAVENFKISGLVFSRHFLRGLALVKYACAESNFLLSLLEKDMKNAIQSAALDIIDGKYLDHFPVDIFQTGSGTSTNMNINEVIANLATSRLGRKVHPNDHVNKSQSSNDVIPTAIHISCVLLLEEKTIPSLIHLAQSIENKSKQLHGIVKTGRTHLMDAMPITLEQELSGWCSQIKEGVQRLQENKKYLHQLAIGGTAVGTGINAPNGFSKKVCEILSNKTGVSFYESTNKFMSLASQDSVVALSGQLRSVAVSLMKIANDLRWMNSGPLSGLAEIHLIDLQPGSSIMPGKVNPVIPESVCMVSAQVIGNDVAIALGGQSGNFQLNVMLPLIAYNIVQSLEIIAHASELLADKAISTFSVNQDQLYESLQCNPILITALNTIIGYDKGAYIAKKAYREKRSILDVAKEETNLSEEVLRKYLDPVRLTRGGIPDSCVINK